MIRIWTPMPGDREPRPAQLQVGERGQTPARERDRKQAREEDEAEDHVRTASARAAGASLQQMSNRSPSGSRSPMTVVNRGSRNQDRGPTDKEVKVKARLYRTALTVSIVAILLEGLGAGWKWS